MKTTHIHNKFLALIFIFLVVVLVWKIVDARKSTMNNQQYMTVPSTQEMKTFQSELMKFSVEAPTEWEIKENQTNIDIKTSNGEFLISRIATDFNSVNDYLVDLIKNNKTQFIEKKEANINGTDALQGIIEYKNGNPNKKIYFVFVDGWIYTLSTASPELFDDLDTITQSFRYTP